MTVPMSNPSTRPVPAIGPRRSGAPVRAPLRVEVLDGPAALDELVPEWHDLADRVGASPFATPAYVRAWWRAQRRGTLQVSAAWSGDALVGLALFHRRRLGPVSLLRPLGHGAGAVDALLVDPADHATADALMAPLARRQVVQVVAVGRGSPLVAWAERHGATVAASDVRPAFELPDGCAKAYFAERPSLVKSLRRNMAAVAKEGRSFTVEVLDDAAAVEDHFDEIAALARVADGVRGRLCPFEPPFVDFLRPAMLAFARRGRLLVSLVRLDGTLAAFDVGFLHRRQLVVYTGRFDPSWSKFGLGHLSLRALVEAGSERGVHEVDLQLGSSVYKSRWCRDEHEVVSLLAVPRSLGPLVPPVLSLLERRHGG